ncbi:MAG: hypothetical protein HY774_10780 [Acidobacteria bacterium]|nr:hypothetical protein [Acidobacteriota bacterium]
MESSRWFAALGIPPGLRPIPFAPGWALEKKFGHQALGFARLEVDPAPIRARTFLDLDSGGCASKQAAHRLLSSAHPGENRPFHNGELETFGLKTLG